MSRSLLKALIATVMFASAPACIRLVAMDSYALGVWRLSLAAVGMTILLRMQGRTIPTLAAQVRRDWPVLLAVGLFFGLHWLTFFQSIKLASASIGALAFSTCGVQIPLLGWVMGLGRPSAAAMAGVALAMGGSLLCLPESKPGDNQALGMAIGILSGTFYAVLPVLHQRHARLDNELRTWAQFALALPVFLVTAPGADWTLPLRDLWLVLYLGVAVNLIGHYLWVQISTELSLPAVSALGYAQLPTSLALNALVIGDAMTVEMLLGATLIVAGNVLALQPRKPVAEDLPQGQ
ncbi:MAG TPA: DMT family transporter [Lacipirellulaceae bacterium]|nr:DMT family transporter [Lacipirellulaceae bacterium]